MVQGNPSGYYPSLRNACTIRRGYSYFCQTCGDIWAKLEIADTGDWFAVNQACINHGRRYHVGGTVLFPFIHWEFANKAAALARCPSIILLSELDALNHHLERFS